MIDVKTNLKELRQERHLTQEQLAEMAGISASYISSLELQKRMPTILILAKLAKVLDVKINELVIIEENGSECTRKYF